MRTKERKTRTVVNKTRQQLNFDTIGAIKPAGSFQATLMNCERGEVRDGRPGMPSKGDALRAVQTGVQQLFAGAMKRAWSFLQTKYKISTTKRLRVSETISLGEKRFVAIVAVEGREFLIGGGVSGMSLLAQLGSAGVAAADLGQKFGDGGGLL